MTPPPQSAPRARRVIPASAAPPAPGYRVEAPWPGVALGLSAGDDVDMRTKRAPNEDSLAALRFDEVTVAAVADAHFGPASSELAVQRFARRLSDPVPDEHALLAHVEAVARALERDELAVGRSETTFLAAQLDGRRLTWASVGDSLLFAVGADGAVRLLTRPALVFLGRPGVADALPFDAGSVELAEGEWALLATDGIEPDCSGIDGEELGALLRGEGRLDDALHAVLERASTIDEGGGGDNLALVALAPR